MKKLEETLSKKVTLLKSIPGMGDKTAWMLLVFADGFKRFNSSKERCSYAGITPTIKEFVGGVRGRARMSNPKLRNLLFMCSFNACKYNKACKALYERIVNKGKSNSRV